jgi:hypothetical protein
MEKQRGMACGFRKTATAVINRIDGHSFLLGAESTPWT